VEVPAGSLPVYPGIGTLIPTVLRAVVSSGAVRTGSGPAPVPMDDATDAATRASKDSSCLRITGRGAGSTVVSEVAKGVPEDRADGTSIGLRPTLASEGWRVPTIMSEFSLLQREAESSAPGAN
jgi:hypothetical protein